MISLGSQAVVVAAISIGVPLLVLVHHGVDRGCALGGRIWAWIRPIERCAVCSHPSKRGRYCSDPCGYLAIGEHLESAKCWCEPELTYRDPQTGSEVWSHRGDQ